MDYSLLLGIYYETPENKEKTAQNLAKMAECTTTIQYELIDLLFY